MEEQIIREDISTAPNQKKSINIFLFAGLLILAVVGIPYIFNDNKGSVKNMAPQTLEEQTPTMEVQESVSAPVDVVDGAISIEAGSFYYSPSIIRVKKGETVTLTLNSVSMMHDLIVDELGIKVPITENGTSSTVEFTANTVGDFEFYCSVGEHRSLGQVGRLIVTE